uniref:Lysosomal acid phosphatase n=1 Tax=Rhabditophanes sp. KR3021 TaxID=114890 RepID=A0AC35TFM2_9BILA
MLKRSLVLFLVIAAAWRGESGNTFDTGRLVDVKADLSTLEFVTTIFRHGDRTPVALMPTDKANDEESWIIGLGELTKEGMAQQYRLGQWIRKRYDSFISTEYSSYEIYARSSDYNRTLMSGQANLAGLFKPTNHTTQFLPGLLWNPIPVHTLPKEDDRQLYDEVECPILHHEIDRVYSEDPQVLQLEKENADFLSFLGNNSGLAKDTLRLKDMWLVFDSLNAEYCHQDEHQIPGWVNSTVWSKIQSLYDQSSRFLHSNDLLKKLKSGPLLQEISRRLRLKAANQLDSRHKYYMYSAHDTSVSAILAAFGIIPETFPNYATMAMIELHRSQDDHIIKIFYKNVTDGENVYEYDIERCPSPCSLTSFMASTEIYIPKAWKVDCGIVKWYEWDPSTYFALIAMLAFCAFFFASLIGIECGLRYFNKKQATTANRNDSREEGDDTAPLINDSSEEV